MDEEAAELNEMMAPVRCPSENELPMINNKSEVRKSKKKNANAAGLLLRGLGSMFRFGKHRKSAPASPESIGSDRLLDTAAGSIILPSSSSMASGGGHQQHGRRPSGPLSNGSAVGRSDVDRHHVLRRTLPPDERDRAELGRQMAMAVARQVRNI